MAGTIIESQLTDTSSSAIRFVLATEEDDAAIRRLLRNNPIPGEISVSFEREPNYFHSASIAGANDHTILAFEKGRLICLGRCSVRDRYINGEVRRVGYLSDLRLDSSAQGRFNILRRGYQFFHGLQQEHPADFYFTSITGDNSRSLRLLQRGLPGMPFYKPLADFVTLLIPVPRNRKQLERLHRRATARLETKGIEVVPGSGKNASALVAFLNARAIQRNLTAVWDEEMINTLPQHGLSLSDFNILFNNGEIIGCAALWDQRIFKQTIIRGYGRRLSAARPILNLTAKLFETPRLPAVGSTLANGYLSPLAVVPVNEQYLPDLVETFFLSAVDRGLEFITLGFAADDPRLNVVRKRFRCREYLSRLFQVRWKNEGSNVVNLNDNLIFPEVAWL